MPDEEALKRAFGKIKDDFLALEAEIRQNKDFFVSLRSEIAEMKSMLEKSLSARSSTGNDGVTLHALSTHSACTQHERTTHAQQPLQKSTQDLVNAFSHLKNYEFKTFLVIYQLHEEKGRANYYEIGERMGVSDACVRSYLSSLLRKGAPIVKQKLNKNRTVLSIDPTFKSLNNYQKLLSLYYNQTDLPLEQTTLQTFNPSE